MNTIRLFSLATFLGVCFLSQFAGAQLFQAPSLPDHRKSYTVVNRTVKPVNFCISEGNSSKVKGWYTLKPGGKMTFRVYGNLGICTGFLANRGDHFLTPQFRFKTPVSVLWAHPVERFKTVVGRGPGPTFYNLLQLGNQNGKAQFNENSLFNMGFRRGSFYQCKPGTIAFE